MSASSSPWPTYPVPASSGAQLAPWNEKLVLSTDGYTLLSRLWAGWLGRWQGCSRTPKSTPSSSAADLPGGWAPERRSCSHLPRPRPLGSKTRCGSDARHRLEQQLASAGCTSHMGPARAMAPRSAPWKGRAVTGPGRRLGWTPILAYVEHSVMFSCLAAGLDASGCPDGGHGEL